MSAWSRPAMRRAVMTGMAMTFGLPHAGSAQLRATLDVGGASVRYADSVRVTATTLAPTVRLDGGPFLAIASGSLSAVGDGAWSSQGAIAASLMSRSFGVAHVEIAGAGGGTKHQDGTRSGQYLGRVQLHAARATHGAWIGAGAGRGWNGSLWRGSVEAELAGWMQRNDLTLLGSVRPVKLADSLRYTDVTATIHHEAARLELAASGGARSGVASSRGTPNAWASVSAAVWAAPQLAVVADMGSYPADFNQGFAGGTYLSVALRIAPHRHVPTRDRRAALPDAMTPRAPDRTPTSKARLEVVAAGAGRYTVRVHAPNARRVEIMGDFTNWAIIDATPVTNGWWTIVMRITPGVHQFNVRLDGGEWTVPAGAAVERDEFGGASGVMIVR